MASPTQWTCVGWILGVGDGQGGLACCGSWGHKELDTTEQLNWTEVVFHFMNILQLDYLFSCWWIVDDGSLRFLANTKKDFIKITYKSLHWHMISFLLVYSLVNRWSDQIRSVAQSCPTLCDPMNHRMPGLSVHHQLPEFTQTHIHRVSDAIQPSHPLLSPSPPAPNPSQHQSLFQWVNSSHEVAKVLEFQL